MPVPAIAPMGADLFASGLQGPVAQPPTQAFSNLLAQGLDKVNADALKAEGLVQAFATDDSIPVHQVTYALEQARLSVELMTQVRARLLEGYEELMRMQL